MEYLVALAVCNTVVVDTGGQGSTSPIIENPKKKKRSKVTINFYILFILKFIYIFLLILIDIFIYFYLFFLLLFFFILFVMI